MSDGSAEGTAEAPPSKKPTPWSVRKIVEQVTGRPLESMQDPPGTRRSSRPTPPAAAREDPPLERYHESSAGPVVALLAEPESPQLERGQEPSSSRAKGAEKEEVDRNPSLRAFLPGTPPSVGRGRAPRAPSLPLTRPLPREVIDEVDRMREEQELPGPEPGEVQGRGHSATRELERVYLSYLLMHMDRLTEPALKYLRHAVEEECEERGMRR